MKLSVLLAIVCLAFFTSCGEDSETNNAPYFVGFVDGGQTLGSLAIDTSKSPPEGDVTYSFIVGDDGFGGDQNDNLVANAPVIFLASVSANYSGVGISLEITEEAVDQSGQTLTPGTVTRFTKFTMKITGSGSANQTPDDTSTSIVEGSFVITMRLSDGDDKTTSLNLLVTPTNVAPTPLLAPPISAQ